MRTYTTQLVDSVLRAGANAGALDDFGRTPLHCLFSRSSPLLPIGLIKRLLAEKVPLEEKDVAGQKPLHCLLRHLNTEGNTTVRGPHMLRRRKYAKSKGKR